jgi:hypothetical protein
MIGLDAQKSLFEHYPKRVSQNLKGTSINNLFSPEIARWRKIRRV